ncbi:MAG: hypothetical protein AAF573_23200, partial [Bacteroidota bacterium]
MKRIYTMLFVCCAFSMSAQYFTEDFEGGLPTDWTLEGAMQLTDAAGIASQYFNPGAHTQF